MTSPIKPGTARRLGLRKPIWSPRLLERSLPSSLETRLLQNNAAICNRCRSLLNCDALLNYAIQPCAVLVDCPRCCGTTPGRPQ